MFWQACHDGNESGCAKNPRRLLRCRSSEGASLPSGLKRKQRKGPLCTLCIRQWCLSCLPVPCISQLQRSQAPDLDRSSWHCIWCAWLQVWRLSFYRKVKFMFSLGQHVLLDLSLLGISYVSVLGLSAGLRLPACACPDALVLLPWRPAGILVCRRGV